MKMIHRILGFAFSIAMILILLVTAFDLAVYGDYGFFEKEYIKYEVLDDLNMEMDDVMEVTTHMMEYLRDNEEDMQITTTVGGVSREFFNGQDIFHMDEVKTLFLGMFRIRTISIIVMALSLAVFLATKADRGILFRCFQISLLVFFGLIAALGIIIAINFSEAFVIFHEIFFDNDLWLFDPATDLMIRMLPEGLFMDFALRILGCFAILLGAFEAVLLIGRRLKKKPGASKKAASTAALLLVFCLGTLSVAETAYAAEPAALHGITSLQDDLTTLPGWPSGPSVKADAAILIDARTGNILYGKNIHETYPPASITKVLTALIACEEGNMSDTVVFSHNAVYDLPWDSSIVGFSEDERVNLKDALYGLMLKSGNEAAQGIAEHIAGSIADFSVMMNERAAEAGALHSSFVNPHGLHHADHYTTAYDMAMILRDAVQNEIFLEIASTSYYEIGPTNINAKGYAFSAGHRMINRNRTEYYEYAVAGKTGYTSKAGNTLVTYAKKGNMELISVILHSSQTQYSDTRNLFDYGFSNFTSYNASQEDTSYDSDRFGFFSFLSPSFENVPASVELGDCHIILPSTVPFTSLDSRLEFHHTGEEALPGETDDSHIGDSIIGHVIYEYEGITVGTAPLYLVSQDTDANTPQAVLPGSSVSGNSGTPGNAAGNNDPSGMETAADPNNGSGTIVTLNIWHLLGYVFLALIGLVLLFFLLRYFSPRQRRARKTRQLRRVYTSDERKKQRRRRQLR